MSDAGSSEAKPKGKRRGLEGVLLLVIFAALIGGMLYMKRPAPMPEAFAKGTLAAANESAQGKPVVAVFTARWCGTCQGYKRGALADAAVRPSTLPPLASRYSKAHCGVPLA